MGDTKLLASFDLVKSKNEEMQHIITLAKTASKTSACVLILGESGVGKQTLAQIIHYTSSRKEQPCIILDCSASPPHLLEYELFGYEPGILEKGTRGRRGKFELANGGTLILREIGHMPYELQGKLLQAIEHGKFERVGGEETLKSNVRIIALSTEDLSEKVMEKKFRESLFCRLSEVTLPIPPLRHRKEDIKDLVQFFLADCNKKFGKNIKCISQIALDYLRRYHFPGNIRELKSLIQRGVTVAQGDQLWLEDLGMRVEIPPENEIRTPEDGLSLAAMERRHIQYVLHYTHGNKKRTAELLQISRPTLDRKIKLYKLSNHPPR